MRVRVDPPAAARHLQSALERGGGSAHVIGDTIELVHPSGRVGRHEDVELTFFVRSWAASSPEVARAAILDRRSLDETSG